MLKQDIISNYWFKKSAQINDHENRFDLTALHYGMEKHLAEVDSIVEMDLIKLNYNLLDLACGNGRLCQLFCTEVKYVAGVDLCNDFIIYLNKWKDDKKVGNVHFFTLDLVKENFNLNFVTKFDTILLFGTSQFIMRDIYLQSIFENISKLLKSNGKFLLKQTTSILKDDVDLDIKFEGDRYVAKYRTVQNIKKLANKGGLKCIYTGEVFNKENVGDTYEKIEPHDNTKQMFFLFESKYGTKQLYERR